MSARGKSQAKEPSENVVSLPRSPGRPKGSKNRRTKAVEALWDPIARRMGRKLEKRFNAELEKGDNCDLSFCLGFFKEASGYAWGQPTRRSEVSGPDRNPIQTEVTNAIASDNRELARRLALIFSRASPKAHLAASEAATSNFSESLNGAPPLQDALEADLRRDAPTDEKASPESSEATGGAFGPAPPPEGQSLWFDVLEVRNVGPVREGLPYMYAVRRGEKEIKRGNWDTSLAQARKLIGEPLPPGRLTETRPDSAVLRPSLTREQRSTERGIHP